jgi:hypothetical protein
VTRVYRILAVGLPGLLLCIGPVVADDADAGIFKRVLPDGTVIFSDQPHPDATRIEPRDPQVVPSFEPAPRPPARAPEPEPFRYHRLAITAPADDEVIWSHEGIIEVEVDVEPALQAGHRLLVLMDGTIVADAGGAGRFRIDNVFRGTHVLVAVIEDAQGNALVEAPPVAFHLRQHSILSPTRPQR